MAKNTVCPECGQSLVNKNCVNRQCSLAVTDVAASLVPDEFVSLDMTQIVDYTGTLGVTPADPDAVFGGDSGDPDADSAQTRMVDDNFYKQIREFFPADASGSKSPDSASDSTGEDRGANPDASQSLNLQGVRHGIEIEEFVPPVRDIRFPSDTASLEQIREMDSEEVGNAEYQIVEKLGEGGYGVVFEAEQVALNRPVAVKVLKPKRVKPGSKSAGRTGTGTGELQRRRDQFLHEAKITARLQHPNIVPLYDFGINTQGQLFYSMKKVERRPWSSVIQSPAKLLDIAEDDVDESAEREAISKNVEIFDKVCDAMAYSHAQKIIHRDLKPDNIMIGDYGEVLLIDFGMALDFSRGAPEFSAGGTLVYMAPEMAEHFAKQKEIQIAVQQTAQKLGIDKGSVFIDQSNLIGIGKLAKELIQQSKDEGVVELAETLVRLDNEERGLAAKISYASDIYLLGAILYQVAVGHPPHYFPIGACKKGRKEKFQKELWLALRNGFQQYQEVTDPLRISLRNIAVKAMRTEPANRFQTVDELQEAIKGFQLEVQSLEMTETGKEELEKAQGGQGYQHLLPALESFRGAGNLWPESSEAQSLQVKTACEYASRANKQKDFDAGLSILDEYIVDDQQKQKPVVQVRQQLVDGKRKRARNRRLAWLSSIAAIVVPIGVFLFFSAQSAQVISDLKVAKQETDDAQKEANKAQLAATAAKAAAVVEVAAAKTQADKEIKESQEAADEQIQQQKQLADKEIKDANDQAEEDVTAAKAKAEEQIAREKMLSDKEIADAKKIADAEVFAARKKANEDIQVAKAEADKYAFDAKLGAFTSNVLTIPLDLSGNDLQEVAKKLELLDKNADPQFKNGWAVSHFRKRATVDGVKGKLGEEARVIDLVSIPGSADSIVVGMQNGKPGVWKMLANGDVAKLNLALPEYGDIADVSISADGQWLAAAMDNVQIDEEKSNDHLWVVNLADGKQATLSGGDGVVGCKLVEFSNTAGALMLVTVEELSGYRGLKQRVQVVTRTLESGTLSQGKETLVSATTRDLGRVRYLADVNWNQGQPVVGLAYQGLAENGEDVFQLESLTSDGADGFKSSKLNVEDYPTAILISGLKLYCGYANGFVSQFEAGALVAQPTNSNNLNMTEVVHLEMADGGRLVSGSDNGALIIRNADYSLYKNLQGQPSQLSALVAGQTDPANGITLISGDVEGNLRIWNPETSIHDATIRKSSAVNLTSGTVDVGLAAGAVPATAFGTTKGSVYYYSSEAMLNRKGGVSVGDSVTNDNATFRFKSPFESFGTAFNDFDSMGIIDDHFVLLKDDGTLFFNLIDETRKGASARTGKVQLGDQQTNIGIFIPLMASVPDKNYFFSTDPVADDQLIYWTKSAAVFTHQSVNLPSSSEGRIKRINMSPDGKWLSVVREESKNRNSGQFVAEVYDVSGGIGAIRLAGGPSGVYQVGDPAFAGFSADSTRLILHLHREAPDRETWIERWQLAGQEWAQMGKRQKLADGKVDVVDWSQESNMEKLVAKANKRFLLASQNDPESFTSEDFQIKAEATREKLRSVLPTGNDNQYYVLSTNSLNLYTGIAKTKSASFEETPIKKIEDGRALRVFGKHAVLLDKSGFHLVDSDLTYVTMLAARENPVKSVSLSSGRLAILYANNLCRVWDVRGEQPAGLGAIENTQSVELSPDGQWAVCQVGDSLQFFPIGSKFDQPKLTVPGKDIAFSWTNDAASRLLVAQNAAGKVVWTEIDPATGVSAAPKVNLPTDIESIVDFKLAPRTRNYVAIKSKSGMSLWAITPTEPIRLNKVDHEFDEQKLQNIEAFSFSELDIAKLSEIGTRLVVLAKAADGTTEPKIFLVATEDTSEANAGDAAKASRYRVVEIEGAFEKKGGRELIDCRFSGDGRSLIQVDVDGTSTLLGVEGDQVK